MSIDNLQIKRIVFDSALFTYSIALMFYLAMIVATLFGFPGEALSQESAAQNMQTLAWLTLAIFIFSAALTISLDKLGIFTFGDFLFAPPTKRRVLEQVSFFKSFWGLHLTVTFFLSVIVSLKMTEFSFYELTDPDGFAGALRLYHGLTHANLALLPTAIAQVIETVFIAFLATVIAVPIAFALSFLSAKNIMTHPVAFTIYVALRTFLNITRSVEPLIWALIFTVWVGVGPFAGMLALMLHSVASLAKQYSEIVEDVSEGPIEGIRSTGANAIQTIWFAIVPQITMQYIAFTIYRWDTNVRMATVIGLVGGGGIGTLLIKYQGQAMWPEVGCIILVIAAVVWLMDIASAYIREALR